MRLSIDQYNFALTDETSALITRVDDKWLVSVDALDEVSVEEWALRCTYQCNTSPEGACYILKKLLGLRASYAIEKEYALSTVRLAVQDAIASYRIVAEFDQRAKDAADRKQRENEAIAALVIGTDRDGR